MEDINSHKATFSIMRIFKNLFGKGDKIHIDEIAYKDLQDIVRLLGWGVIVESGSNSDGQYMKFGNGWQICFHRVKSTMEGQTQEMRFIWSFPKPFMDTNYIGNGVLDRDDMNITPNIRALGTGRFQRISSNNCRYVIYKVSGTAGDGFNPDSDSAYALMWAIGRWK